MGDRQSGRVGLTNVLAVLAISLLATLGCSSSDSSSGAPSCGTTAKPIIFTLKDVSPAAGSSVPNSITGIVMTFTIVGLQLQIDPAFVLSPTLHTAGPPTPNPITWGLAVSGNDTIYTSVPFVPPAPPVTTPPTPQTPQTPQTPTWTTAPGHVEMDPEFVEEDPSSGCVYQLPTPTFSYDITAP